MERIERQHSAFLFCHNLSGSCVWNGVRQYRAQNALPRRHGSVNSRGWVTVGVVVGVLAWWWAFWANFANAPTKPCPKRDRTP